MFTRCRDKELVELINDFGHGKRWWVDTGIPALSQRRGHLRKFRLKRVKTRDVILRAFFGLDNVLLNQQVRHAALYTEQLINRQTIESPPIRAFEGALGEIIENIVGEQILAFIVIAVVPLEYLILTSPPPLSCPLSAYLSP